jgi:hypothetical protein
VRAAAEAAAAFLQLPLEVVAVGEAGLEHELKRIMHSI